MSALKTFGRMTAGAAMAVAIATAVPANATPSTGLMLLIDDSGSISGTDFALQKTAYINSLTSLLPTDGSVALGVLEFDSTVHTIFSLTTIDATEKANLIGALGSMTQIGGSTATGPAIEDATTALTAFTPALSKMLIDVSTDGFGNVGVDEATAAADAIAAGVSQVNVLCIGGAANCSFNAGTGSFNIPATFDTIEASLTDKLTRELSIPEPSSMALLGIAAVGVARTFRRKRS